MKAEVRQAGEGDLDRAAEIWHESARRMDGADPDMPSLDAMRRRIDAELEGGWLLFVAARGADVLGMLALKPAEAVLDQIFVLPDAQGKGLGRALLNVAKREMPEGFTLRAAAANAKARRFYERQGLTLLGEGRHPHNGAPVCHYGWSGRKPRTAPGGMNGPQHMHACAQRRARRATRS